MAEKLLEALEDAEQYFAVVNHYNELIEAYKKDTMFQKDKYWNTKFIKKPFIGVSILIVFVSVVFSAFIANVIYAMRMETNFKAEIIVIPILSIGIVLSVIYALKRIKQKKDIDRSAEEFWQNEGAGICQKNEETINEISAALDKFITENIGVLNNIPPDYRNFGAVSFMANAIRNLRASTLGEAVNLYEEELHRITMQMTMDDYLYNQRKLSSQLYELNVKQAETNSHLKYIEDLQIFDMLSN